MLAVLDVIRVALDLYFWIIIISAVMSWLVAFNVVNPHNQFVGTIGRALHSLTEPVLGPIRRVMPNLGGIDISPIIVILGIIFLQSLIVNYGYPAFR